MILILAVLALQSAPASTTPVADPAKKICRSESTTGSMMHRSVCHTRAQWNAIAVANGTIRDDFRDKTTNAGLPSLTGR